MGAQAVRLSNVDIDNALKNKDFEVLFQPIFDLGNGALARVESFVRWRHPKLGLLPPGAFISFFESQGRMSELTRYVMAHSLRAYTDWRGPYAPGLSINLALSDLSDDSFTTHFLKLLRDFDFPADLVTLECPMPAVDMPTDVAAAHFQRIAATGARLAIEVRGRANDLLRALDPFPFDEIKTGGSAILRFARTVRGPGLSAIADLLDLASQANAAITAVGVEDQASLAALRGLGFTAAQGNHLGKVGELKEFRPHRINEVRALLELDPLPQESLTALFRTEAPSPLTAAASDGGKDGHAVEEDALIGRLNDRVAQFDVALSDAASSADPAAPTSATPAANAEEIQSLEDKKAKAREKAKALMLAKRAKARAERKAAAIDRAKTKAAQKTADGSLFAEVTDVPEDAVTQPHAAREMQERLTREFPQKDAEPAPSAQQHQAAPQKPVAPAPQSPPAAAADERLAQKPAEKPASKGEPFIFNKSEIAPAASKAAQQPQRAVQAPPMKVAASAGGGRHAYPGPNEVLEPFTVSLGSSGAYFQPGIRVGTPALPGAPDKPIPPAALNISAAKTPASAPLSEPATAAKREEAPATASDSAAASDPATQDHLDAAPKAPHARRKKPFLKRTIIAYPKHFWPRPWRRAWKRRASARAVEKHDSEMGTLAAE